MAHKLTQLDRVLAQLHVERDQITTLINRLLAERDKMPKRPRKVAAIPKTGTTDGR